MSNKVRLKKNWIWDVLEIDWSDVSMTLKGNKLDLPNSMVIPFGEKFRARKLLREQPFTLHIILKQNKMWFTLNYDGSGRDSQDKCEASQRLARM